MNDTGVEQAGRIVVGQTVYRRFYGTWRPLTVVRLEQYRNDVTGAVRVLLTVQGDESAAPFVLPPMDVEALVKVAV